MTRPPLTVDCSQSLGRLKPALHGTNLGPNVFSLDVDLVGAHQEMGFSYVRTHDCPYMVPEAVDVHAIFPLFHLDVDDPANYRFQVTDDYLQGILATGAQIYFRLGESIEHYSRSRYWVNPPPDFDKWARICVNIIRHYTEGWANGFHYDIAYWEIWNEPANGRKQWTGTRDEFFRLYATAARAIKAHNPRLKVGGCSIAGDWVAPFIDYCIREQLPLDFYSHHWYGYRHERLLSQVLNVRQLLDDAGFQKTESHLNEWNYLPGESDTAWLNGSEKTKAMFRRMTGANGAAFIASTLIMLHDSPLDMAHCYHSGIGLYGLFEPHGHKTKVFHALKAFHTLLGTPERISAEGGKAENGFACLAGKSEDGNVVRLLASNFEYPCGEISVHIRQLPWEGTSTCRVHVLDAHFDLALVQTTRQASGDFSFNLQLPPATVALVEVSDENA